MQLNRTKRWIALTEFRSAPILQEVGNLKIILNVDSIIEPKLH